MNIYINQLIHNLPDKFKETYQKDPLKIDIIFEGGLFNGSYLAGCIMYLKELDEKKYITINKISTCSIGCIAALLYFIKDNDLIINIYKLAYSHFKTNYNIDIFNRVFNMIKPHLPDDIMQKINNRFYISYFNLKTGKRIVKKTYKNIDNLFEIIRRSCSFPYVIDNQVCYKNKYIDGLYPFVFKPSEKTRILYLNIHNLNKITNMISIKNEKSNIHRIMEGILEIHIFFMKNSKTDMCSFTDEWDIINYIKHFIFIHSMNLGFIILHKLYILNKIIRNSVDKQGIHIYKLIQEIYIYLLSSYCI